MRYLSPVERRLRWNRWTKWTLIILTGFLIATPFDLLAQSWLPPHDNVDHYDQLEANDWVRLLRSFGDLRIWIFLGVAVLLHDLDNRRRPHGRSTIDRAVRVFGSAVAGGAVAEILKLILRRERPGAGDLLYSFKPLTELFSSSNVGLPSSHTAVAAAGAATLAILMPWSTPVVIGAALGCGVTRILVGAHHVSDVYLGFVVGVLCAMWVCRLGQSRTSLDLLP